MAISLNRFHQKGGGDVPITDGGTNASDGATALSNLGATIYDVTTHDALITQTIAAADEGGGSLGAFSLLRFLGAGVTAADGGSGELDVTIPGFGGLNVSTFRYNTSSTINFNPGFSNYPVLMIAVGTEASPDTQGIHVGVCVGQNGSITAQGNVQVDAIGSTELDTYTDGSIINSTDPTTNAIYTVTTFTNSSIVLTRSGPAGTQVMDGRLFVLGF